MAEDPVIVVEGLVKSFDGRTVLDGINFKVFPGQTLVIMGGSGCGKTTLLKHLISVYRPDSGRIMMLGRDITEMEGEELNEIRKHYGVNFQFGALYNSMTVGENVALPMTEHTNLSRSVIEIMVKMKLELVGLRDFENLKPSQISGGMKKRVALARSIALDPEILFYDEPTSGLDPINTGVIDQLIMDLSKKLGVTSVVVTHDMASAFKIADQMIVLYLGKVVAQGTPEEVRRSDDGLVQQFITGAPDGPIPLRPSKTDFLEDLIGPRNT